MSSLVISETGLLEAKRLLGQIPRRAQSAQAWAINRTATHVRSEAAKLIRSELNIKSSKIKKELRISRASRHRPVASIFARYRGLTLRNFNARDLKSGGVSVKVKRGGRRKKLRSAFMAPLNSGVHVARRLPGAARSLEVLYGPSPSQAFGQLREELTFESKAFFLRQLRSRVDYELTR